MNIRACRTVRSFDLLLESCLREGSGGDRDGTTLKGWQKLPKAALPPPEYCTPALLKIGSGASPFGASLFCGVEIHYSVRKPQRLNCRPDCSDFVALWTLVMNSSWSGLEPAPVSSPGEDHLATRPDQLTSLEMAPVRDFATYDSPRYKKRQRRVSDDVPARDCKLWQQALYL